MGFLRQRPATEEPQEDFKPISIGKDGTIDWGTEGEVLKILSVDHGKAKVRGRIGSDSDIILRSENGVPVEISIILARDGGQVDASVRGNRIGIIAGSLRGDMAEREIELGDIVSSAIIGFKSEHDKIWPGAGVKDVVLGSKEYIDERLGETDTYVRDESNSLDLAKLETFMDSRLKLSTEKQLLTGEAYLPELFGAEPCRILIDKNNEQQSIRITLFTPDKNSYMVTVNNQGRITHAYKMTPDQFDPDPNGIAHLVLQAMKFLKIPGAIPDKIETPKEVETPKQSIREKLKTFLGL